MASDAVGLLLDNVGALFVVVVLVILFSFGAAKATGSRSSFLYIMELTSFGHRFGCEYALYDNSKRNEVVFGFVRVKLMLYT